MRRNPLERLKQLPWLSLFLDALLTVLCVSILEIVLLLVATSVPIVTQIVTVLLSPPLGILTEIAIGLGVGALAVVLLERFFPRIRIDSGSLWALLLCLILAIAVKTQLALQLVNLSQTVMMGMLVGVFWYGRRYWRYR